MIKLTDLLDEAYGSPAVTWDVKKTKSTFTRHAKKIQKAFKDDNGAWVGNNGRNPSFKKLNDMVDKFEADLRKDGMSWPSTHNTFEWFSDQERHGMTNWDAFTRYMSR